MTAAIRNRTVFVIARTYSQFCRYRKRYDGTGVRSTFVTSVYSLSNLLPGDEIIWIGCPNDKTYINDLNSKAAVWELKGISVVDDWQKD